MSRQITGKLKPERCALLVCDVQERFTSLITGFDTVVDTCRRMVLRCAVILRLHYYRPLAVIIMKEITTPLCLWKLQLTPALLLQVAGATALELPILVTEQYPKALGATKKLIQDSLPSGTQAHSKLLFSMCGR